MEGSTMSGTTRFTPLRTLAFAGAILAAGLAAPAAGHAQGVTAERTLLNSITIPSFLNRSYADPIPSNWGIPGSLEGARALLGQTPVSDGQRLDPDPTDVDSPAGGQIEGERALLGRRTDWMEGVAP
jgi:hypothetical protein